MNAIKTTLLLGAMTLLLVYGGLALGGEQGMILAFIVAVAMNFGAYFYSDKLVLKMYRAQPVTQSQFPEVYQMVGELTRRAGIPMPRIYHIPSAQPNAFATGRNPENAAVAFTDGILNLLDRKEFMGVMAHELAHIKNRDILIGTIVATMAGAISMLANIAQWGLIFGGGRSDREGGHPLIHLLMIFIAPIAALLVQMAVSRTREYQADRTGAELMGDPAPLANALAKLERGAKQIPMDAEPATAHMFIVSPLSGKDMMSLFSTHPPMAKRIEALMAMRQPAGR